MTTSTTRTSALVGAGGAILALVGAMTLQTSGFMEPAADVATAVTDDTGRLLGGAQIAIVGFVLLTAYGAVLGRHFRLAGDDTGLATSATLGYAMAGVLGMAAAAGHAAAALRADQEGGIGTEAATAMIDVSQVLLGGAAPAALALGVGATSLIAVRISSSIPRWLAYIGLPLAVGLLILPINFALAPIALLWTAATAGAQALRGELSPAPSPAVA